MIKLVVVVFLCFAVAVAAFIAVAIAVAARSAVRGGKQDRYACDGVEPISSEIVPRPANAPTREGAHRQEAPASELL